MQSPNATPEQASTAGSPGFNHAMSPVDVNHNGDVVAGTKRKLNGGLQRGVATLTPEQLARKRANDRQAQRAIRERTKAQIEALEQKVRELSSQQPHQDIQKLVSEKEKIAAENQDIKRRLGVAMSILQPLMDKDGPQTSATPMANSLAITPTNGMSSGPAESTAPSPFTDRNHDTPVSLESQSLENSWSDSIAGTLSPANAELQYGQRPDLINYMNTISHQPQLAVDGYGEKLILNFLIDNPSLIPKISDIPKLSTTNHSYSPDPPIVNMSPTSSTASAGDHPKAYLIPIQNTKPTCPLDAIFLDFLKDRRRELMDGSQQRLAYPSVSSLLNPAENSTYSYSISKVFTDILRTFPDISSLPEQVGILYAMFQIMRWQIFPTQQNYDRIPDWITPRPAQLFSPHPAWVDYILWPKVRDRLSYTWRDYPFENWFVPYTRTISCNWPYEPTDCLLHNTESDELVINPVFERHIRELTNWTVGTEFAEAFPSLVDAVKIKSDRRSGVS